jgi:GH15 family glucan-1,4-alpha-glucosidase
VFGAILDADRGGSFRLAPENAFELERRYLPDTNLLETTFRTPEGAVRVTDALSLPDDRLGPQRELQRWVEGLAGTVPLRWRVEPRFDYGRRPPRIGSLSGVAVASAGGSAFAIRAFGAGESKLAAESIGGRFEVRQDKRATTAAPAAPERELALSGYRGSRPVRIGNAAADQLQLDTYGELLQTAWIYAGAGNRIDRDVAARLTGIADLVCASWSRPDAGIWEVRSEPAHFTQSKMMCWIALDRAIGLAERGILPGRSIRRWRRERTAIEDFIERRCWSPAKGSYVRFAGGEELDASVLLALANDVGLYAEEADPAAASCSATSRRASRTSP